MFNAEDVVNDALALIGDTGIGSFSDDERGFDARRIYANEVGFALAVHPFSWSRRMILLTRSDEKPSTGHLYLYALPPDRLGPPLRVTDDATDPDRIFNAFELVDGGVASDAEALWAQCTLAVAPSSWSSTFRQTLVIALAGRFAYTRSADKDVSERLLQQAYGAPSEGFRGGLMRAAISEDARATPPRRIPMSNPLLDTWRS